MYLPLNDFLFLLTLFIFLIAVYHRIINNIDLFGTPGKKFLDIKRKFRVKGYIRQVTRRPEDTQKVIFKESLFILTVLFVMFILGTKAIFFTAVVSGSMVPTFNRDDLVLMQDIDHRYKAGDIIFFVPKELATPYTHRIIGISEKGIRTRGDATTQSDWWILKDEDILGKAVTLNGKPIVIKGYGRFFIIDDTHQDFGPFGQDYRKYQLFFQVVRIYGYVIVVVAMLLYIALTVRQKPWQNR
jgi:signal peptidase